MDQQAGQSTSQTTQPGGAPGVQTPHQNRTLMGILAYLGILVVIPFIVAKDDPFVKFHIKQGLVLFVIDIIVWFIAGSYMVWSFWPLLQLLNLCILVLTIIGIINVAQGKEKDLPIVGSLAHRISL